MGKITLKQARAAKNKLSKIFEQAASLPINGIGIGGDKTGYFISVNVSRKLSKKEKLSLPLVKNGVPVKYKVVGPARAF